jgi:molecular chaperone DnaK
MNRQTVDFGIDLGTTNSVIARATAGGVETIRNDRDEEIIPSAVAVDADGDLLVGSDALDQWDPPAARSFKRLMGTDQRIALGDQSMTPEGLSAEVLKALKEAAHIRYGENPRHVVVTIPAMFLQSQCEATHQAASLAGLEAVALLQEPIAAATAFLGADAADGVYVVFDLGGGTFDTSVIRLKDQRMAVLGHGGDNFLGGSDWDRLLADWVLRQVEPAAGARKRLTDGAGAYRLRRACEDVRKRLTTRETASLDLSDLGVMPPKVVLPRTVLDKLIAESVDRCVRLTHERLTESAISMDDVRAILLVGGPTRTPYLRARLSDEFGVPLLHDRDPMTVVAAGAAIHASTLLIGEVAAFSAVPSLSVATLELHYDAVVQEPSVTVSGRIVSPAGFAGEVRIQSAQRDTDTGWIALRSGSFCAELSVPGSGATEFHVSLRDTRGSLCAVSPSSFAVRCGIAPAQPVTPYGYGVVKQNDDVEWILPAGRPLPAYGKAHCRIAKALAPGSEDRAAVYFVEGLSDVATDNTKVGELWIEARDLRRPIRQGDEVEIRMRMDESRLLTAKVFVPLYDLEWEVGLLSRLDAPPLDDLRQSLREAREALGRVRGEVTDEDERAYLQAQSELDRVEADMEKIARSDPEGATRVAKKLSDAKPRIRSLVRNYDMQARHREVMASIDSAEAIAERLGDSVGAASGDEMRQQADRALELGDVTGLVAVERRADRLFWEHYTKTPECWAGLVEHLQDRRSEAVDPGAYHTYLSRAEDALARDDLEGVRINGVQAMRLLPEESARENRFWASLLQ